MHSTHPPAEGSYRHILTILFPIVLSNMAFTIMQFTDRILLTRYSSDAIQAAIPAGALTFTFLSFFAAIAGYSGTFVAQYFGANDHTACRHVCGTGIFLSILFTPFFVGLYPLCKWVFSLTDAPLAIQELECQYSFWMCMGGFFMSLLWVLSGFLTGRNRVQICTICSFLACGLNIGLDYVLIFGKWGFPQWGIRGAAIATFLSMIFHVLCLVAAILYKEENRRAPLRDWFLPEWSLIKRVVRFGFPSGLQLLFDTGSFALFCLWVSELGPLPFAASNIALSINNLAFSPLMGFSNATAVIVGQFIGAEKIDKVKQSCKRCLRMGWIYMTVLAACFIFLPETLLRAFSSPDAIYTPEQLFDVGRTLLLFMGIWGLFDATSIIYIGALKGAGDTRFVMLLLTLSAWLGWIPLEWLILKYLHKGIIAAWVVQVAFIIFLALCFHLRWRAGRWQKIHMIHPRAAG